MVASDDSASRGNDTFCGLPLLAPGFVALRSEGLVERINAHHAPCSVLRCSPLFSISPCRKKQSAVRPRKAHQGPVEACQVMEAPQHVAPKILGGEGLDN